MNRLKLILVSFLISSQAFASLPPTTSKGAADASNKVTFNYQFPGHPISHAGPTATILPPTTSLPNFIGQTTDWKPTNTADRDFEASVGNWVPFADGASAVPTDLTGGSPSVTCTRSTTNPLDGTASLLITKGASNLQGNGCSVTLNVQPAYQGTSATVTMPMSVVSGSLVSGDIKLFAYNVTKSALISMDGDYSVMGGNVVATFPLTAKDATPVNHQYRLGIYFASTATTAVTLKADNISVSPAQAVFGMAGSNPTTYTPTIGGQTSITAGTASWHREGKYLVVDGYSVGTNAATNMSVSLPAGLAIDSAYLGTRTNTPTVGEWSFMLNATTSRQMRPLFFDGSDTTTVYAASDEDSASNQWAKRTGTAVIGSAYTFVFKFKVPIVGWDSGWAGANSAATDMSAILANGSRVTTTPARLGEWRSQLRNASANTFTDTNGSPTNLPSATNGIWLPRPTAWGTVNSNNQPTRYQIYIGPGKFFSVNFFSGTGFSSPVDASVKRQTSTQIDGYAVIPSNGRAGADGLVTIVAPALSACTATPDVATDTTGATIATAVYAQLIVSENALAVGIESFPFASYNSSTTTALTGGADTVIPFANKVEDTHGAYNTSTGVYTTPQAGLWCAKTTFVSGIPSWTVGNQLNARLYKNGSHLKTIATTVAQAAASFRMSVHGEACARLNQGDTLAIYGRTSQTTTLEGTASENWVEFRKVSN